MVLLGLSRERGYLALSKAVRCDQIMRVPQLGTKVNELWRDMAFVALGGYTRQLHVVRPVSPAAA